MLLSTSRPGRGTAPPQPRRPAAPSLAARQVVHSLLGLWRSRVAMVFTFLFPLTWLVVVGFLSGNDVLDPSTGVRVMQFVTPTAAAMGVLYATMPTVAAALAQDRESGVLKRVHGTPLPGWAYLAGKVGASAVVAFAALLLMLAVGVAVYDVQVVWRTATATVVTVLLATAGFAAIGLAVAGLARSAGVALSGSIAAAVVLGFVSDLFTVGGELTGGVARFASLFPLQHFVRALKDQFDPYATGAGWDVTALLVMVTWAAGASLVAAWALRRPVRATVRAGAGTPPAVRRTAAAAPAVETGRPATTDLLVQQLRWSNKAIWRDLGSVFFAVAMPVGLYAFVLWANPDPATAQGVPLALGTAAGMSAWGAAVTGFVNMPESVLRARDRGVLKRLRGTPLPPVVYLAARAASVLWLTLLTAALVLLVGLLFFDLEVGWSGLPLAAAVLALGGVTLGACGLALASLLPDARSTTAVGLGLLLPVAFFSDVFWTGGTPEWMATVGSFLPLKHVVEGVSAALDPAGPAVGWVGLAVLLAWLLLGAAVARRRFDWRTGRG